MEPSTIDIALRIAVSAHAGALDKAGQPYILHPVTVGMLGQTDEEKMAGFLHDVVEDTDWTFEDLLNAGVPNGVVNALRELTHDKSIAYMDYIRKIIDSGNPIALMVKSYDLEHNLGRSADRPENIAKYTPALAMVKEAIAERSRTTEYVPEEGNELAVFACGCFWGTQHQYNRQAGVVRTTAGYTGGDEVCPSYVDVRAHKTHHVEAVAVEYNPSETDYRKLCRLFFEIHDPAQTDGVGPDIGPQYRSCIFYRDSSQLAVAEETIADLRSRGYEVNTLLLPLKAFYAAEEYHQDYYEKTCGDPYCHIRQKKF